MGEENGTTFKWREEIERIYYNAKEPGSFYSPEKLYSVLKKRDRSCTLTGVRKWMQNQSTYNIHRSRKFRFERRKRSILRRSVGIL